MKFILIMLVLMCGYAKGKSLEYKTLPWVCSSFNIQLTPQNQEEFYLSHPFYGLFKKIDECKRNAAFNHLNAGLFEEGVLGRKGTLLYGLRNDLFTDTSCKFEVIGLLPPDHPIWTEYTSGPDIDPADVNSSSGASNRHMFEVLVKYQDLLFEKVKFVCPENAIS